MVKIIDLNIKFITKEDILREVGEINVFKHYTNIKVELNKITISPLRNERNASFGYFKSRTGEILFNDFVLGGGDCVKFVMLKFNLTWFEALSKIAIDFQIDDAYIVKKNIKTQSKAVSKKFEFDDKDSLLENFNKLTIQIRKRHWKLLDYNFWNSFGITKETLERYNVSPVDYIFLNGQPINADIYAYAFKEEKDNEITYKIYQPFNPHYKWINNHNNSIWQGWTNLPEKGETLIITKSLKDVMSISDVMGIPSISLQAESTKPKDKIINELIGRFFTIYVLYDNDYDSEVNWGEKFGEDLAKKYNFIQLKIPDKYKSKDFSDLIKNYGREEAKHILNNMLVPY